MEAFAEQVGTAGLFCRVPVPRRTGSEPVPPRGHRHPAGHKTPTRTSTRREKKERETQEGRDGDTESTQVPTASGESLLAATSSLALNQVDTIAPHVEERAAPPEGHGTQREEGRKRDTR